MKAIGQSMFLKRLLFLQGVVAVGVVLLGGRLAALTLGDGEEMRDEARARLVREQWTPAPRGRILDRKGRVLAEDRPAYDVVADYSVISGEWAVRGARSAAARLAGTRWADMSRAERDDLIAEVTPLYVAHLEAGWDRVAASLGVTRAEIDERRAKVMQDVERRQAEVTARRLDKALAQAAESGVEMTPRRRRSIERDAAAPIAEKTRPHPVAKRVADEAGFACRALADEQGAIALGSGALARRLGLAEDRTEPVPVAPGLAVVDAGERDYPMDAVNVEVDTASFPAPVRGGVRSVTVRGLACHLLGRLRESVYGPSKTADGRDVLGDAQKRAAALAQDPEWRALALLEGGADRGAYREGDRVGDVGIEGTQEFLLRGLRGVQRVHLDSNERDSLPPTPGRDVAVTLDAALQARVQALFDPALGLAVVQPWHGQSDNELPAGTPLNGACVVLDVQTGEVLACVSTPTFSRADLQANAKALYNDEVNTPMINRAIAGEYPPGSIVKPLLYAEAAARGRMSVGERIACTGHYLEDSPNILQCLIFKRYRTTHSQTLGHDPDGVEAIGVSCNIMFYTVGERLGPNGVEGAYRDFCVGEKFGLGAGYEASGRVGAMHDDPKKPTLSIGDCRQMGIGQGPVTWTPLHAAAAYATLARGGEHVPPRLLIGAPPGASRRLPLPADAVRIAMDGLWYATNEPTGTGEHLTIDGGREPIFTAPGVKVWGKTGTATAPVLLVDPDGDGPMEREVARKGDHSWFVVLVGRDRPRYAISVMVEYGGSGGKVSGPIANQVIYALMAEGYL
ncbi:MAG TPA: penicillin-binding transpeptidase domain-containing protein [Phycisphaerales bacterium]|nr:penicillin-binding transpeptidase domain-containing protein [Phycisphaerales bacterium]